MKKYNVNGRESDKDKREEKMKGKKSVESWVVYGKASSESLYNRRTNPWNSRKQVSNDSSSSKSYLSPWEHVPYKSSGHGKNKNNDADRSCLFKKVRPIIDSSANVKVHTKKKKPCSVCMRILE